MAAPGRSYNRYQYETSPKKIVPKVDPPRTPIKQKKSSARDEKQRIEDEKKAKTLAAKTKAKLVLYLVVRFCCLICYWI